MYNSAQNKYNMCLITAKLQQKNNTNSNCVLGAYTLRTASSSRGQRSRSNNYALFYSIYQSKYLIMSNR